MAERKKGVSIADYVKELADPIAKECGVTIWDTQFVKEGADWFLRVFIDKDGGINIDDCVNVTRPLNLLLDEKDPISQEYTLEVSSCGINRKLTKKEHFQAYLEKPVLVKLIRPTEDGRREIEGILIDVLENGDFEVIIEENLTATFTKKECVSVNIIDEFDD